jgi:hypothetical protein
VAGQCQGSGGSLSRLFDKSVASCYIFIKQQPGSQIARLCVKISTLVRGISADFRQALFEASIVQTFHPRKSQPWQIEQTHIILARQRLFL